MFQMNSERTFPETPKAYTLFSSFKSRLITNLRVVSDCQRIKNQVHKFASRLDKVLENFLGSKPAGNYREKAHNKSYQIKNLVTLTVGDATYVDDEKTNTKSLVEALCSKKTKQKCASEVDDCQVPQYNSKANKFKHVTEL